MPLKSDSHSHVKLALSGTVYPTVHCLAEPLDFIASKTSKRLSYSTSMLAALDPSPPITKPEIYSLSLNFL